MAENPITVWVVSHYGAGGLLYEESLGQKRREIHPLPGALRYTARTNSDYLSLLVPPGG